MADPLAPTDGPVRPGDNPNLRNMQGRRGVRPRVKNSPRPSSEQMRMAWIDPLPVVDPKPALGMEPVPEEPAAGEIDLDFDLPGTIARPFCNMATTLGDRIGLAEEDSARISSELEAVSYLKAARQLYSTMLEHEKAANQPLKAVYYDETPVPAHMAAALSIIGHIDTKMGKVLVRNASTLFKRWVVKGLQSSAQPTLPTDTDPQRLVWQDADGLDHAQYLARQEIDRLTKERFTVQLHDNTRIEVSPPQLADQPLEQYYESIPAAFQHRDRIRDCVAILRTSLAQWRNGNTIQGHRLGDCLERLNLQLAGDRYSTTAVREAFEDWMANYITRTKHHVEGIFRVAPPPAGSSGFGAQTVTADRTVARWNLPLSDSDAAIGFMLSPARGFRFNPRIVAYSRRDRETALAAFATSDGRAFA